MPSSKKARDPLGDAIVRRIVALREARGLSQNQMAKETKIPQSTISSWENVRRVTPNVTDLAKLCRRYGWNPAYLVTGTGDPYAMPSDGTTSLQSQALMLSRVELAIQEALQGVRGDLLRRQEAAAGTDAGTLGAVEAVEAASRGRKRSGGR